MHVLVVKRRYRRKLILPHFAKIVPGDGLAESTLSRCLYYSQRLVTIPVLRNRVADLIARVIRTVHGKTGAHADNSDAARLKREGFAGLGNLLDSYQCAEIRAFLDDKYLSGRYGSGQRFKIGDVPDSVGMAEYDLVDIINCPHVLALANSERLLGLAEQYLGCKPTLSSLMLRWSFPTETPVGNVQRFHRDADDWRYLKIMVYLTDVGEADGPHVYVLGTHKEAAPLRIRIESDEAVHQRYGRDAVKVVTGPAGSSFAVDTAGIHKGEMPHARSRLMLQMQYSLLPTFANRYCPQAYSGEFAFDRYVNRLMVA
jgi:hypothetical protein